MEQLKISVVIVSFNRVEQLRESLAALSQPPAALQIVVVDNGSRDGAPDLSDEFPNVRFDRLPRNFGLTRALNIGARAADGDYVLLMHDDTLIDTPSVFSLAEFLESRTEVGAVCPKLGGPQVSHLPTPSIPDPELQPAAGGDELVVERVRGAAIMVRTAFLRSMGYIDEHYGNYGSDLEICARVRSSNRKVVVLSGVTAQHAGLRSPMPESVLQADRTAGIAAFLGKHHGAGAGVLYRVKTALRGLITFRFGLVAPTKIDGSG